MPIWRTADRGPPTARSKYRSAKISPSAEAQAGQGAARLAGDLPPKGWLLQDAFNCGG